jgi:hypothetical protein
VAEKTLTSIFFFIICAKRRKMMKKKLQFIFHITVLLLIFIAASCSDNYAKYTYSNYHHLTEPDVVKKIDSTIVNTFDIYFPSSLEVINDYLIFADSKADTMIKVIDRNTLKLINSFGRRGQGPGEFIGPGPIFSDKRNKNAFFIYEISSRKLTKYNLNNIINNDFNPIEIITLSSGNIGTPAEFAMTQNEELLGIGIFYKDRISIFDLKKNVWSSIGKIPVLLKKEQFAPQHSHGFIGSIAYDSSSQEIFVSTRYGSIIEKYNIKNGLLAVYLGPDNFFPQYDIVPAGDNYTMTYNDRTRFGYLDIHYNEKLDRLFLLYSGKYKYSEVANKANFGNIIYVINNKEEVIEKIVLDKEIIQMAITEDGSKLYGLSDTEILCFNYF